MQTYALDRTATAVSFKQYSYWKICHHIILHNRHGMKDGIKTFAHNNNIIEKFLSIDFITFCLYQQNPSVQVMQHNYFIEA